MGTYYEQVTMHTITCNSCGVLFAVTEWFHSNLKEYGHIFYCPNGHKLVFNDSAKNRFEKREKDLLTIISGLRRDLANEKATSGAKITANTTDIVKSARKIILETAKKRGKSFTANQMVILLTNDSVDKITESNRFRNQTYWLYRNKHLLSVKGSHPRLLGLKEWFDENGKLLPKYN